MQCVPSVVHSKCSKLTLCEDETREGGSRRCEKRSARCGAVEVRAGLEAILYTSVLR